MSDLRWTTRWGYSGLTCDYGHDVGNLHVIDYIMHEASLRFDRIPRPGESPRTLRISPADWSR